MKKILKIAAFTGIVATCAGGCLTASTPRAISHWTIECASPTGAARPRAAEDESRATVRLSQVTVRPPYDGRSFVIRRGDGSVAFDAYNQFAAQPSAILRGAALDALQASAVFRAANAPLSAIRSELSAELTVSRLELDCTQSGARKALVALTLTLVRDRALYAAVAGEAAVDAADGNYTRAFSAAFAQAIEAALGKL